MNFEHIVMPGSKETIKENWVVSKEHKGKHKGAPINQIWENMSIKKEK